MPSAVLRTVGAGIAVAGLLAGGAVLPALAGTPEAAQVRYVSTTGSDATDCTGAGAPCASVQHAVDVAASGDTISIARGTYAQNVLVAGKSLVLRGAPDGATVLTGYSYLGVTVTVRATAAVADPDVTLDGLSLSDNTADPGLEVDAGTVQVDGGWLERDTDYGAVVYSPGSLRLSDTVVDANNGAGVAVLGGTLALYEATVSGNVAQASDENAARGGVDVQSGTATIVDSTLGANGGPGLSVTRTGTAAAATVADSTINGNIGAGIYASGATVGVTASTVAATRPLPTGGVGGLSAAGGLVRSGAGTTVRVGASIVAEQAGGVPDCAGAVVDRGWNLSGDAANSCRFTAAHHSLARARARLAPLAHHGGITWTRLPGRGSAALRLVPRSRADCVAGARDQRGVVRLARHHGRCDTGAVELG